MVQKALRLIPYGVHVVTMRVEEVINGFTCSWMTQVSGAPPMIAVVAKKEHRASPWIQEGGAFVVNLLGQDQKETAERFFGPPERLPQKFDHVEHHPGVTGAPILADCLAYLECKLVATYEPGDHSILVGEIVKAEVKKETAALTTQETKWHYTG